MFKKILAVVLVISNLNIAYIYAADDTCSQPVTHLDKGAPAPCSGFLFSPTKETEVRKAVQDNAILQSEVEIKDKQINLLKLDNDAIMDVVTKQREETELWRKTAVDSTTELVKSKNNTLMYTLIGIGIGMAAVGIGGLAMHEAGKL